MGLDRQVTGGIYWINLYDKAPYGAVIGHTCFAPFDWYHEHVVYLASYFTGEVTPDQKEIMIKDFCKKFDVRPEEIKWADLAVDPYAGPLYITGYKKRMNAQCLPNLFIAGMHSPENYPERSIEGSVSAGLRVVDEVNNIQSSGKVMT
jgi:protoporphyrinogen oxidase